MIMLIFGFISFVVMVVYNKNEATGFTKILPITTAYMVMYSLIPFLVCSMVIYSKGFHDFIGELIAWFFALAFLIAWVRIHVTTDTWIREKYHHEREGRAKETELQHHQTE